MRSWWTVTAVRFRGICQAVAFLGLTAGIMAADRVAGDPVHDVREALRVPVRDPMKNPGELEYRQKNVGKRIDALKNLGDMRRAIVLQEWRDEDREEAIAKVDRELRGRVIDRLAKGLRAVMQKGDPASQQAAAEMLADIGVGVRGNLPKTGAAQELAPDLVRLTKSPVPKVRMAAARALGKIHGDAKPAATALGEMLKADEPALRKAAAEALDAMVENDLNTHKGRGTAVVEVNRGDLINAASAVVGAAAGASADPDAEVRKAAVDAIHHAAVALSELVFDPRPKLDFPPVERKLTDDERAEVEDYAKQVEGERRELAPLTKAFLEQAPAMRRSLSDANPLVRLRACRAMEEVGNARLRLARRAASVPPFDKKIPKADDHLYAMIRQDLGVLLDRLHDDDVDIRLATLNVLETLDQDAAIAIPYLIETLDDPNRFVRWAAVRVLGKTVPAEATQVVTALANVLTALDIDVRVTTAEVIGHYGAEAIPALPALIRAVTIGDAEMRMASIKAIMSMGAAGKPAVPTLMRALRDDDPEVRKIAADALARLGPDARPALAALGQTLNDEDPDVRKAASDAILAIQQQ